MLLFGSIICFLGGCWSFLQTKIPTKVGNVLGIYKLRKQHQEMKYMKIGILPDTFYTEEASRTVLSDVPSDLTIQVNSTRYRLHKFPLLLKCGLLQRVCSDSDDSGETAPVQLHNIPGGQQAFELCAKFCYGIAIKLSARNFVPVVCAAKFLRMTESVSKGNLLMKLESFFDTCMLHGWKDSISVLQATSKLMPWSENLGITQRCIDSIVQNILKSPSKVNWSYTYTRPGYDPKQHKSVPKDWWTEDISDLDFEVFRSIISSLKSIKQLLPQLIGEALHVYACKHLLDPADPTSFEIFGARSEEAVQKQRQILESIVSMIPMEHGSVSGSFLLRLLKVGNYIGASSSTVAELVRRAGHQLHEAKPTDLLFPSPSTPKTYDVDLVKTVLDIFLSQFRQPVPEHVARHAMISMQTVAEILDSCLQSLAHNQNIPVNKIIELAETLPEIVRANHDNLYMAIDIYLKEHRDLSKTEKKQLCRMLDCRKLSSEMRSHAIRNESLPLRTVIQVLYIAQEEAGSSQATKQACPALSHVINALHSQGSTEEPSIPDRMERGTRQLDETESKISRTERSRMTSERKAITNKLRDINIRKGQASSSKHK